MSKGLRSLVETGTKLWLDSIDPELIPPNMEAGATGATSNPLIVADLIKTGRFDDRIKQGIDQGDDDETIAWSLTDHLVSAAQAAFLPTWESSKGNDGYVSFELDPLLEAPECPLALEDKIARYVELGKKWSAGHKNRMIKVPATEAGLGALEELAAAGITLNVTLIFSDRQYQAARDNVWKGAQRRASLDDFKSVYSIFMSRIDVYTMKEVPALTITQGEVGIINSKLIWAENESFWSDKNLSLQQEIIFASTGTKLPEDPKDKYVAAVAGGGIQTNPPSTNDAVEKIGRAYSRTVDKPDAPEKLEEIENLVDMVKLETTLLEEGTAKFADPHKSLIALIAEKRRSITA
jgi:transaldolase